MNRLDRAYALIPAIECRGLCHESCGPVQASDAEQQRIYERNGVRVDFNPQTLTCALLKDGKCSIYPDRPFLCRAWGVVAKMPCVFGCQPNKAMMSARSETKAFNLIYGNDIKGTTK